MKQATDITVPSQQRRAKRRSLKAVVAVAAISLIAAACSSSPSSSSSTTAAPASTPGVTSSSITLGATVPLTGPAASGYDEIAPAMNAVFAWKNAHGGVYGRKINYIYYDDAYNPANTTTQTRKLVLQDNIFATVGSLGTPTQTAVQGYLNSLKIPQMFIESGCNCWSDPKFPYSSGWEPPYSVEGKILGYYIKNHFAGKKIGYFTQNDEFGQDVVKGLDMEIASSDVVSRQTYDPTSLLSGPPANQMAALKAAGAQVVVFATIPAATSLAIGAAEGLNWSPQYVVDSVGADSPTVGPLLSAIGKGKGLTANTALNGTIFDDYIPPEAETSNAWVQVENKLLKDYAPATYNKYGLDGNTEYGIALAYTFVQALEAAGPHLTRQGLLDAIARDGKNFITPGLVPLSYSSTVHFGYEGAQVFQYEASAPQITVPSGSWIGGKAVSPVYTTSPGAGPVNVYSGTPPAPPASLVNSA